MGLQTPLWPITPTSHTNARKKIHPEQSRKKLAERQNVRCKQSSARSLPILAHSTHRTHHMSKICVHLSPFVDEPKFPCTIYCHRGARPTKSCEREKSIVRQNCFHSCKHENPGKPKSRIARRGGEAGSKWARGQRGRISAERTGGGGHQRDWPIQAGFTTPPNRTIDEQQEI